MPNWTSNKIKFEKIEDLKKVLELTKSSDDMVFDFDKIIPEPKTKDSCPKEYICNPKEEGIEPTENREWFNWYKWHNAFWGTKWNACDTYASEEELCITFDTAWSAPEPIIQRLCELFPDIPFESVSYYEEGGSYHTSHLAGQPLTEWCNADENNPDWDYDEDEE